MVDFDVYESVNSTLTRTVYGESDEAWLDMIEYLPRLNVALTDLMDRVTITVRDSQPLPWCLECNQRGDAE